MMFSLAIAAILTVGTIQTGCRSSEQKVNAAEANVVDAKLDLQNAEVNADEAAQNALYADEWRVYKTESELKIRDNEIRITELKRKMNKPGKILDPIYAKKIENLEQRNKNLKLRMETYDKNQTGWVSFKEEFKHDMDELGQAFKDLTVDNK